MIEILEFVQDDGGRAAAGYRGEAGDCVVRAIAIASGLPYQRVYDELNSLSKTERGKKRSNARSGVFKKTYHDYIQELGFRWVSCMKIGSGCKVHLRRGELPDGVLIVRLSKHLAAVVNGVLRDTHDCSRNGTRCVYGYYLRIEKKG